MTQLFPPTGSDHLRYWRSQFPSPGCYVYVIQGGDYGPVKIGKAKNVYKRIATLQTGNAEPLRLLYVLAAGEHIERELHRMAVPEWEESEEETTGEENEQNGSENAPPIADLRDKLNPGTP